MHKQLLKHFVFLQLQEVAFGESIGLECLVDNLETTVYSIVVLKSF